MKTFFLNPDDPRWLDYLAVLEHDLYHLPAYVRLAASQEGGAALAFTAEADGHVFFVPLILRRAAIAGDLPLDSVFDVVSPYGYPQPLVGPRCREDAAVNEFAHAAIHEFIRALKERGVVSAFLRLHPLLELPDAATTDHGVLVTHGETVAVDLSRGHEGIWLQMGKNHARKTRKAVKAGYSFVVGTAAADAVDLFTIYSDAMDYLGADDYYRFSPDYFAGFLSSLSGNAFAAFVEIDGVRAAAMLLGEVGGLLEYHLGGTRKEYRRLSPMVYLTYCAALWGAERGDRLFHLGGGVGAQHDSLFAFKAGFSDLRFQFRTWRIVVDTEVYGSMVAMWEQMSGVAVDPAGFFPAYRQPLPQPGGNDVPE